MRRLLLAFPLLAAPAAAQPATPDSTLPEVSVVATRAEAPAGRLPARVVVLDRADSEAVGAASVADLLEATAPAQLRRYGPGGVATLSVRGAGAGQTSVLLDGRPLTDPQLGIVDLALLPAALVSRVELMHGAGSALHGAGAIGGVVALSTPVPGARPAAAVTSRAGAWAERGMDALVTFRAGGVGVLVAGAAEASRDDYQYFDPNAGVAGSVVRRAGADRALASVLARLSAGRRTRGSVAAWVGTAERGAPGAAGTAPDQGARQWDRHLRVWGDIASPAGAGVLRAGALVQRASLRYAGASVDDTGRTWLGSADAEWRGPAGPWELAAGAGGGAASASHPSLAEQAREGHLSAWTSAIGRFGPASLFPALRGDAYLRPEAGSLLALSPRMGASVTVGPSATLRASAGTAFRPPTFNDRFWRYADPAAPAGDPSLRPERGWTADTGARIAAGPIVADLTAFVGATRDQIVWLPAEGGLYTPRNLARTVARGLEVTLDLAAVSVGSVRLTGGGSYAFTDARDWSTAGSPAYGRPLRYVARHAVGARAGVGGGAAGVGIRADVVGRILGSRPTRADGGAPLPAHAVLDVRLRLGRAVGTAGVELGLAIENVTDTRYAVVEGYPMPPRHASITLRLSF